MTQENDTSKDLKAVYKSEEQITWERIKKQVEKQIWQIEDDLKKLPQSLIVNEAFLNLAKDKLKAFGLTTGNKKS